MTNDIGEDNYAELKDTPSDDEAQIMLEHREESLSEYGRSVPIRTCYAYSPNVVRCDMPAGHPGDHSVTTTWSDDECWQPESRALPRNTYVDLERQELGPYPGTPIDQTAEPDRFTESGTPVYDLPYIPVDDGVYDPATDPAPCILCGHPRSSHTEGLGQCNHVVGMADGQPVTCSVECLGYVG